MSNKIETTTRTTTAAATAAAAIITTTTTTIKIIRNISGNFQTVKEEDLNLLENMKNRLNEIRKHKVEGVMFKIEMLLGGPRGKTFKLLFKL